MLVLPTPASAAGSARARTGTRRSLSPVVLGLSPLPGRDPQERSTRVRPSVVLAPAINPTLTVLLARAQAQQRTSRSFLWNAPTDSALTSQLRALLALLPPRACLTPADLLALAELGPSWELSDLSRSVVARNVLDQLAQLPAPASLLRPFAARLAAPAQLDSGALVLSARPARRSRTASLTLRVLIEHMSLPLPPAAAVRLGLDPLEEESAVLDLAERSPLGLHRSRRAPLRLTLAEAIETIELAQLAGIEVFDLSPHDEFTLMQRAADRACEITRVKGAPGLAQVEIGAAWRRADLRGPHELAHAHTQVLSTYTSTRAGRLDPPQIDSQVAELARVAAAPRAHRVGLLDYQDEFCSRYAASERGLVNALDPGMGKTVCAAVALAESAQRAQAHPRPHRSLVVVPAALRPQWAGELRRFFPEAQVRVIHNAEELREALVLARGLSALSPPLVIVISYDLAAAHVERLVRLRFDELVVDEAATLRGSGVRTKALWRLRRVSTKALALTGTPLQRSIDDVGVLVAFTRGERDLFSGAALSSTVSDSAPAGLLLGPTVFRRTRDVAQQIPTLATVLRRVELSEPELELAERARVRLRRRWEQHQQLRERLAQLPPHTPAGSPRRAKLLALLRESQTALLSETNLARAIATDPLAAASLTAPLRPSRALMDELTRSGCSKREHTLDTLVEAAASGAPALVFADFVAAADAIAADLACRGVPAAALTGSRSATARTRSVEAFTRGELAVLTLSGVARHGLNLQTAQTLVHYDLPLSSAALSQRVGRALRLGSGHSGVVAHVPVARDTIDETLAPWLLGEEGLPDSVEESGSAAVANTASLSVLHLLDRLFENEPES